MRLIVNKPADNNTLYLSNFWRFLNFPLINCGIGLDLSCPKELIISEISIIPEVRRNNPVNKIQTIGPTFQINNAKLYVPVVTLSYNDNIKYLESLQQGIRQMIVTNIDLK